MNFLECPIYLWLTKHRKDLLPPKTPEVKHILEMGREVDNFSRRLFPEGVEVKGFNMAGWRNTQKLMNSSIDTLFQPTAVSDPLTCRADILTRNSKVGGWDINEVKMATSVKKEHPYDAAFQRVCFENAGIPIGFTNLVRINNQYTRHGDIEPEKLFVSEDITDEASNKMPEVKKAIEKALIVIERNEIPDDEFLRSCGNPKTCEYLKYYLDSIGQKQEVLEIEPTIDAQAIRKELEQLEYPLYFLDYETYSSAIPPFDGTRPYQNIPFQYSLHIKESSRAAISHKEFLARVFENPVPALLVELKLDIGPKGSVIVWNASFEKKRNEEMAIMEPAYAEFLNAVNGRAYDLMLVFKLKRQLYVKSEFQGSASLKKVLPVLCPELAYDSLAIQEGMEASASWPLLTSDKTPEAEKTKLAGDMLAYCKRDTEAMVCILDKLNKEIK